MYGEGLIERYGARYTSKSRREVASKRRGKHDLEASPAVSAPSRARRRDEAPPRPCWA
jgi:ribosomal protein L37AE/L43A